MHPRAHLYLLKINHIFEAIESRTSLQNNPNYKLRSPKSAVPPPTAQTTEPILLISWLMVPRGNTFGGIVAIFEFRPLSRDIRHNLILTGGGHVTTLTPISRLIGRNSKIAMMPPKVFPLGIPSQNMNRIGLVVWAVEGGTALIGAPHLIIWVILYCS